MNVDQIKLDLLKTYEEMKDLVNQLEDDVVKATKNVRSASLRLRRSLREIAKKSKILKNSSLALQETKNVSQ